MRKEIDRLITIFAAQAMG